MEITTANNPKRMKIRSIPCQCSILLFLKKNPADNKMGALRQWIRHKNEAEIPKKSDLLKEILFVNCNIIANIGNFNFYQRNL